MTSTPDEKYKKRRRIQSNIAKDLHSPKYHQRIVKDKRGKLHDLDKMTHMDLVEAIQEEDKQ
jgi:hypothetical protein